MGLYPRKPSSLKLGEDMEMKRIFRFQKPYLKGVLQN